MDDDYEDLEHLICDTLGCIGRLALAVLLVLGGFGFLLVILEALKRK